MRFMEISDIAGEEKLRTRLVWQTSSERSFRLLYKMFCCGAAVSRSSSDAVHPFIQLNKILRLSVLFNFTTEYSYHCRILAALPGGQSSLLQSG